MSPEKLIKRKNIFSVKRTLIAAVLSLLKNESPIEPTRHRSSKNFFVNLWAGIIAYKFLDKKPSLKDYKQEIKKIELFQDIAA